MLCSNCGFENPTGHHFCGMCGTPLPKRPIIAPGAQSTADLTRHPLEISPPAARNATSFSSLSTSSATEAAEPESPVATGPNYFSQAEEAESLDQFIAGFHYTPPAQEEEVTMTGAKAELDDTAYEPAAPASMADAKAELDDTAYEPAAPASMADESSPPVDETLPSTDQPLRPQLVKTGHATPTETLVEQPPLIAPEPPPFALKGAKSEELERSRFLEFSEPTQEAAPANEAELTEDAVPAPVATSIGGPSFLGLSDAPPSMAYVADEGAQPRSHWHLWTALVVVAIFAILGFLEWRAVSAQSSHGPIGIMKMQLDRLRGNKAAVTTTPSAPQPTGSGPQMQVAPQPKPQPANPQPETKPANPGAASNSAAATTPVAKAQPATAQPSAAAGAPKPQTPSAKTESTKAEAATNSANPATQSTETEKPAKPTAPGAEELAKAANASDAAAASAWLWKSVAKGNPEAPIKLANMYIKGEGVPQSCDQAMVLLRSAAAKENATARSRLGTLYATGTCVPRNRVRAYQYMSEALAANPNAAWARDFRQQLWTQMTPDERQRAQKAQ